MGNTINILSENVIDKIAAGEVVERPASAIKELIENSIDAKATAITIEIKNGGKKLMRVSDNGVGIEKSEVKKAFIRHATSKIETEDDLNSILSLGFRGEALASIAAVSNVEMITKVQNDITGKRIVIEGSEIKCDEEVGAPDGTTIIINDLFYNVPARKKFLKSDQSEATEINEIVNKLALAHSEISFKFINNGKVLLHTDGQGIKRNAIFNVYGRELVKEIVDVESNINEISISGFIGRPVIQRATRVYENFFVNGRYIKSSILSEAVEEAFYGYIMKGKFPFCSLEIEIEPELIDINVHPAKTEIRFKDEELVYETVKNCIKEKLESLDNTIVVSLKTDKEINEDKKLETKIKLEENKKTKEAFEIDNDVLNDSYDDEDDYTYEEERLSDYDEKYMDEFKSNSLYEACDIKDDDAKELTREIFEQAGLSEDDEDRSEIIVDEKLENEKLNTLPLRDYKIIGQLFNTYFLVEEGDNFYLIDQHAAEEKVLYERLKKDYENKTINTQLLLDPIIYNATPKEYEVIKNHIDKIRQFGFDIDEFGDNSFRITEVPYIFEKVLTIDMFNEIIDELLDKKMTKDLKTFDDMFATVSCKAAIKAHDKQSIMEGKKLIEDLMKLENPFNCPHGRPVIITITRYELEKKFKRII